MRCLIASLAFSFACGCAAETTGADDEEGGGDDTAIEGSGLESSNSLTPNGLMPNGLMPNGLAASSLTPGTITRASRNALQDGSRTGQLSRMFLRYVVSCAFDATQSYTLVWRDKRGRARKEIIWGSVGLAPEWQSGPLSERKQRWVSACMAARTNYFGVEVVISARGDAPPLASDAAERRDFDRREGAFWGNLFATTPALRACHDPVNRVYSRSRLRLCAAGHDDGAAAVGCENIEITGDCSTLCDPPSDPGMGFPACDGTAEVITTFLE